MILDYAAFAEAFHDFFVNIFPNLKISTENEFDTDFSHWFDTGDRVLNAISKCKKHPSVVIINEKN